MTSTGAWNGVAARLAVALWLAWAGIAHAQESPDVPTGAAKIFGRLVHPKGPESVAQVGVMLYALEADGSAGLRRGATDDDGRFEFKGVSNDPRILYLVGARVGNLPFGTRFSFGEGALEHELVLELSDPSDDTSGVRAGGVDILLGRGCADLTVRHSHELHNPGGEIVFVPEAQRAHGTPLLEVAIPAGARGFESLLGREGIERVGDVVRFWGPLYPGSQEIQWSYGLPLDPAPESLAIGFPRGAVEVQVRARPGVARVSGTGLEPAPDAPAPEGDYARVRSGALAAGETLTLNLELGAPGTTPLALPQAQLWLELDDAALEVNQEVELQVDGTALPASAGAPLLCLDLPADAAGLRFSNQALQMGLERDPSGDLALHGPLPTGRSTLSLRYHLPVDGNGARLRTAFDRELPLLTVLVADTGVVAMTKRMHRRRAVRTGDRMYLHYEAFAVEPGERIEFGLERTSVPDVARRRVVAVGFALIAAAAALGFLIVPLRRSAPASPVSDVPEDRAIERTLLVQALADIDEDFDTGKLTAEDHAELRGELRAQAAARLRAEREASDAPVPDPEKAPFCSACGVKARVGDRFCAACGTELVALANLEPQA